ncbi:hypothetical protein, variant [Aphanomyces invadans]|uniref:Uncharacterized protein n=1 Tax=Aphanomyces invadans TaxID=157072 RepID=A0A024TS60_9STRA|nr:hypothetical protein, variant [Aphanomyces invadans]XP_008874631.1 hypothetical protein H310_10138 [Aphanomyces invadans]ETV96853.1 hypothetical protein H310_10138 [Aphanomyces invadans]ETV96854.1 hypothetical protein, variant [Aphanomyces invadans]|eukprot:XP_008874630.1 hypothetical protein, variant [Aphanomyces invadans]
MVNFGVKHRKAGKPEMAAISWRWVAVPILVGIVALAWLHAFEAPVPTTEMHLRSFESWIRQHGGRIGDVQLAVYPGMGIGVQATNDIDEMDEVLYLPRELVICRDTMTKHLPRGFLHAGPHADDDLLAAFLLLERLKGPASKWAPYLAVLPKAIPSPMTFTTDEVLALQDAGLIQSIFDAKKETAAAFTALAKKLSSILKKRKAGLTLDDYIWARAVLDSRALTIQGTRYLVPFADMFNGQAHPTTRPANNGARFLEFHQVSPDGVRILADRSCAKNDQLVEDYGDNDNYIYLVHHGFTMSANPFDCVRLALPSPLSPSAAHLLASFGVPSSTSICVQPSGVTTDVVGWAILQAHVMDDADVAACAKSRDCLDFSSGNVMSIENVARWVRSRAVSTLMALDTSADDDKHVLAVHATSLSPAMLLVVTFRLQRKLLLQDLVASLSPFPSVHLDASAVDAVPAATTADHPSSAQDKVARFHAWLAHSSLINKLRVEYIGHGMGYGTFATQAIAADDIYLAVPTALVMDTASAMHTADLAAVFRHLERTSGHRDKMHELLLHVMHEAFVRRDASAYAPYLAMLPSLEDGAVPLTYSKAQVGVLEAVDLHRAVLAYQHQVERSYRAMQRVVFAKFPKIFPPAVFTWERYRWARFILDTRSIWWHGERHLVPMLDMVNCKEGPTNEAPARVHTTTLSEDGRTAVTKAAWAFPENAQVLENYGQPNWIYLLYHGFVLPVNSHDCVHIRLDLETPLQTLEPDSALYQASMAKVRQAGLTSLHPDFCLSNTPVPKQALLTAALYVELQTMTDASFGITDEGDAATAREMKALRLVLQKRRDALSSTEIPSSVAKVEVMRAYMEQQHLLLARLIDTLDTKLNEPLM